MARPTESRFQSIFARCSEIEGWELGRPEGLAAGATGLAGPAGPAGSTGPEGPQGALPPNWRDRILGNWLDLLQHPAFLRQNLRPSSTKAALRIVGRQINNLKKHGPRFVDQDGVSFVDKAIASLEAEQRHLLSERGKLTYECELFGRSAPKELGNVELAERDGVSVLVLWGLRPSENPYNVLEKELASTSVSTPAKTIQMRVRRLDEKIRAGQHRPCNHILEYQYLCFKYCWFFRDEPSAEYRHWGCEILPVLKRDGVAQWHGWNAFRRGLAANLHDLGVDDKTIQAILSRQPLTEQELNLLKSLVAATDERLF